MKIHLACLLVVGLLSSIQQADVSAFLPISYCKRGLREKASSRLFGSLDEKTVAKSISVGFIGCGTIASAIATGLADAAGVLVESITVTRRSAAKSAALSQKFPDLVSVVDENQQVVDHSDIVFLTVLPEQTASVLQSLKFDNARQHTLVSLVSTSRLDQLASDSRLPSNRIYKMICLPAVSYGEGICLLQQGGQRNSNSSDHHQQNDAILPQLLETLGGVVMAEDDKQMSAMMVVTGLMGSFYGVLRNNRDWLVRHGLSKPQAEFLVTRIYHGMMQDAERQRGDDGVLDKLIKEQTPGGLNEQGLMNLESLGVMEAYDKVQDAIFLRILGKSDGSL